MSDGSPTSQCVRAVAVEHGYESPTELFHHESIARVTGVTGPNRKRRRHIFSQNPDQGHVDQRKTEGQHNGQIMEEAGLQRVNDGSIGVTQRKVSWRDRIGCFTWTWFTMTMATGGMANVLHSIPYRSDWLDICGITFFLLNIVLYLFNCVMLLLRFNLHPGSFQASLTSQTEALFIPASIVSIGIIFTNISQYIIPKEGVWLQSAMETVFWLYGLIAVLASCGIYLMLWSTQSFPIQSMTPIWIFPAYPLLITAPFGSNLIDALSNQAEATRVNAVAIALGSLILQSTGFLVSMMVYGAFIYRLMTQKLPRDQAIRPGIFVSVGPAGFTVAGFVHLGNIMSDKILPSGYMGIADAALYLKVLADLIGFCLWGLCIWFFLVSVGSHWDIIWPYGGKRHPIHFAMNWYSFVFPNTALITATQNVAKALDSDALKIIGTIMAVFLVIVWLLVFSLMVRAFILKRLLWPEENRQDGHLGRMVIGIEEDQIDQRGQQRDIDRSDHQL